MGLLDDLRREAELAREAKEAEEACRAERERLYCNELVPRLLNVYHYLAEMLEHLETADCLIETAYDIPGVGRIEGLQQGEYRLYIDSREKPKKVTLQFACTAKGDRKFLLPAAKAEEFRQFLTAHQVVYGEWPLRDGRGQISETVYQARLRVRAGLVFEADVPSSRIRVVSYNFEDLLSREHPFNYADVDEGWLDDLGHFLLRKKNVLGGRQLSPEAREKLHRLILERKAKEEEKLQYLPPEPAENDSVRPSILRVLRSRLFGTD